MPSVRVSTLLPWIAAIGAAACYGFMGIYLRRWAPDAPAKGLAVGTQICAGLMMLPLLAAWPPPLTPPPSVLASVAALGLLSGAVAYVLYFRLVADLGATGALTVTYLVPLFAMLWGALFLAERITPAMAGGAALVIAGTLLVLKPTRGRPV
jgi:drug/metabolite transporter (DMT)-like permease